MKKIKHITDDILSRRDKKELKQKLGISGKRLRALQKKARRTIADRNQKKTMGIESINAEELKQI